MTITPTMKAVVVGALGGGAIGYELGKYVGSRHKRSLATGIVTAFGTIAAGVATAIIVQGVTSTSSASQPAPAPQQLPPVQVPAPQTAQPAPQLAPP